MADSLEPATPSLSSQQPVVSKPQATAKETISIQAADLKPTPPISSSMEAQIDEEVILSLKKKQRRKEIGKEMGIEDEDEQEALPASVAIVLFLAVSKAIDCPRFALSEKEAEVLTESLNAILKELGVQLTGMIVHGLIVVCVVAVKVINCRTAIFNMANKMRGSTRKMQYDEKAQAMRTV